MPAIRGASARTHWSLRRAVASPGVPAGAATRRAVRNPIDAFILARLEAEQPRPVPGSRPAHADPPASPSTSPACRRRRRRSTRSSPTPSADAYEKLVDRLLASPRYGERWARHWLDVVRFAESARLRDEPRRGRTPGRTATTSSARFNDDKPYDRFVREQLAGDALGADEATGFLVAGPWDQVKSPDPVLTAQQRADELHDMVGDDRRRVPRADGRLRPLPRPQVRPDPAGRLLRAEGRLRRRAARRAAAAAADADAARWREAERLRDAAGARSTRELDALRAARRPGRDGRRRGRRSARGATSSASRRSTAKFVRFTVLATNRRSSRASTSWRSSRPADAPRNVALASARREGDGVGHATRQPDIHKLEHLNDGRYGNGRSWISNEAGRGWVAGRVRRAAARSTASSGAATARGSTPTGSPTRYRIEVADDGDGVDDWSRRPTTALPFGTAERAGPPAVADRATSAALGEAAVDSSRSWPS